MTKSCRDCFHMRARIPLDHLEEFGTATKRQMAYARIYATSTRWRTLPTWTPRPQTRGPGTSARMGRDREYLT